VGSLGRYESSRRRAEDELERLSTLAAHLQPPAVLAHGDHHPGFEAAAEVGDSRPRADAGDGSGGTEHGLMLRGRRATRASRHWAATDVDRRGARND
jgi:hypothetical protein